MKKERDYHARLVVYDLPSMSKKDVNRLRNWLLLQADDLWLSPKEYSQEFTGRLMK